MKHRVRIFVSGRVQGVFFRSEVRRRARDAGVAGWVRNLPDGRLEAVLEGPPGDVEALVAWCRVGPPAAEVRAVDVTREDPEGLETFDVRG